MSKEIKLPEPDTHCWDDDSSKDVWSYSPELVRQIIEADRAQRGEPVAWGLPRDDGTIAKLMLAAGICHTTKEAAELHRKALILVSGGTP